MNFHLLYQRYIINSTIITIIITINIAIITLNNNVTIIATIAIITTITRLLWCQLLHFCRHAIVSFYLNTLFFSFLFRVILIR